MKRIFISGPIQGMEKEQSYRNLLREICRRYGFKPIDPWLREKIIYRKNRVHQKPKGEYFDFIKRDLEDIENCDIFLAYLPRLSAGTCMELFYAKRIGKKTITICKIEDPSPWIVAHSDILLKSIDEFEEYLEKISR